jgi:hypothetical protein
MNLLLISNFMLVYLFITDLGFTYSFFHIPKQMFSTASCSGVAKINYHLLYRLNFLSINRFERKKNLDLAISAFALLRSVASTLPGDALQDATLTVAGTFCVYIPFRFICRLNIITSWVNNARLLTMLMLMLISYHAHF